MASREELLLKAKGLATFADKLSAVPEGSLSVANNVVIDKDGLISPRRGYKLLDAVSSLGLIESMHTFDDKVWIHRDSTADGVADTLAYYAEGKEVTNITAVADVSGSLDGTYFLLYDAAGSVAFWIDVDDSGTTIPAGASAADRAIEITAIATDDTAITVGSAIYTKIITDSEFVAGVDNGDGTIEVQSNTHGNKTNGSAGDTGFTITEGTAVEGWVDLTTSIATPTDVDKIRSMQFAQNAYFASDKGVQKLDDFTGDLVDAGAPEGIACFATDSGAGAAIPAVVGTPGIDDVAVAYRIVWGYKDANENLILGAPSARTVFTHTSEFARDVDLVIPVPSNLSTAWFYQVYRSNSLEYPIATPETPSDELFLVFEGNPTQNEVDGISTLTHTDTQPETLLGTALYTNATQDGILAANFEPPKCRDMAIYQNHAFYANTETKYGYEFQLLKVGAPGLQVTDTITIDDLVYTAVSPGTKEITEIITTKEDQNTTLDGKYFILYDDNGSVAFWFDVVGGTTEPAHGATRAVKITTISAADSITVVGTAVYAAIIADSKFEAGADPVTGTITVQSTTYGVKTDGTAGDSGFSVSEDTAGVDPVLGTRGFVVDDAGNLFQDIEVTAKNLVKAINDASGDIVAYYNSDTSPSSTDLPGKIRLAESDFASAPAFTTIATAVAGGSAVPDTWLPNLTTSQTSTNEAKQNRIYYSKELQAEAVPINNFFDVGAANDKILRVLPLREFLLIFTEAGIYKLSGVSQSSFQVTLSDNTVKLLAVDSAVVLDNNVFGLFDQGICKVSDVATIISRPIEGELLSIRGAIGTNISKTFGISYESDRKYIMYTPSDDADDIPDKAYVYNTITKSWTNYGISKQHGIVNPVDDKIYMCAEDSVSVERKEFNEFDIADEQIQTAVTSVASNVITLPSATIVSTSVGDLFYQSDTKSSVITAVDNVTNEITVVDDLTFTTATSEIRKFIPTSIVWNPIFAEKPSTLKQFSELTLLTSKPFRTATLGFKSVQSPVLDTITINNDEGGWGLFGWGEVEWGGSVGITSYRTYVPLQKQRDTALTLSLTQNAINDNFEISGFSLIYRLIGSRVGR